MNEDHKGLQVIHIAKKPALAGSSKASTSGRILPSSPTKCVRLESFRAPRDLSLSSSTTIPATTVKPPKRKFEPIIPSIRNKPKVVAVEIKPERDENKKKKDHGKKKKDHGQFKGRGRGHGRVNNYIQLQGSVFGEMQVLPVHRIKERYESRSSSSAVKKVDTGPKPYFKEEDVEIKQEKDSDLVIVDMKRCLIDDPKVKPRPGDANPISVPFRKIAMNVKQEFVKLEVKKEEPFAVNGVNIKQEVKEEGSDSDEEVDRKPFPTAPPDISSELSISDILQGASGSMFLLQMPDCLPGRVEAENEPRPGSSSQDSTSLPSRRTVPCTLKDLGEGLLGHIEFMASGRVRLNFGNGRVMYLEAGTPAAVRQEVLSVDVNEESHTGTMKVLGEVLGHAICSPDWDTELEQIKQHKTSS